MVYFGTSNAELIYIHEVGNPDEVHSICLEKSAVESVFDVSYCCDPNWGYRFRMDNNSDYERVKMVVMECIFDCESTDELLDSLSEIFEDGFDELLVGNGYNCKHDNKCDCNGHCKETNYLN